jgi:hypothetical protein
MRRNALRLLTPYGVRVTSVECIVFLSVKERNAMRNYTDCMFSFRPVNIRYINAMFIVAACWATLPAEAQTWNYQSNSAILGGNSTFRSMNEKMAPGYVTLQYRDGKPVFQMFAGNELGKCYQGDLDADVVKTEETTTITVPPKLIGCFAVRFIIKNDGTGGTRETKSGDQWRWDRFERDLTLRK